MSQVSKVVIVGRMNVGKSTLFNRLAQKERSITLDYAGVTRDFIKDRVDWSGVSFDLIDSGGISVRKTEDELLKKVREKVLNLIESADLIVFMIDGVSGVLQEDLEIAKVLHKLSKPVIIAVNKIDNKLALENLSEIKKLGFPNTVEISAQHGLAINDLLDLIITNLPKKISVKEEEAAFKVVFLGRPNVGKSSLMNALLNQERSIVSDVAGTTREAISEQVNFYSQAIELTDTAGVRRKRAISGEIEPLMVKSTFFALKHSNIVVLLIDGSESTLLDQDLKLAFFAFETQYKALILLINKQDLITDESKSGLKFSFDEYKHLIKKIPVLEISCKSGKNVGRVLPLIQKVWSNYSQTFEDAKLNQLFISGLQKKPLFHKSHQLRIYEVKQIATSPITISLLVNEPDWFGPSQLMFFENLMRSVYDISGAPIKFILRKLKS